MLKFSKAFILQTDTSNRGVGAVLSQIDGDGDEHPVAYFSRKLLEREEEYSTIEKECLVPSHQTRHTSLSSILARKAIHNSN